MKDIITNSHTMNEFIMNCKAAIQTCKSLQSKNNEDDGWMNNDIKQLMNERDYFKRKSHRNRHNLYLKARFNALKNQVTSLIRISKRDYHHKLFQNSLND